MKKVIAALGLPEKSTEEEAVAAIEALCSDSSALKALQKGDASLEATLKEAAGKFVGGDKPANKKVFLTRDASVFDEVNYGFAKQHAQRTASGIWSATANAKGEVVLVQM